MRVAISMLAINRNTAPVAAAHQGRFRTAARWCTWLEERISAPLSFPCYPSVACLVDYLKYAVQESEMTTPQALSSPRS